MPLGFESGVLFHPYTYLGVAALLATLAPIAAIYRRSDGAAPRWLAVQFGAGAAWIAFNLLHFGGATEPVMLFGQYAKSTAMWLMTVCWVGFAVTYTDRSEWVTRRRMVLLALPPVAFLCLVWTDPMVHVLWSGHTPVESGPVTVLVGTETPLRNVEYAVQTGYAVLGGLILYYGSGPRRIHRRQVGFLVAGATLVVAGAQFTATELYPYPEVSIAPFFVGLASPLFLWAFMYHQLFDLAPVARDRVVGTLDAPVVVVDDRYRVIDWNAAATGVVGIDEDDAGDPLDVVFPAYVEQMGYPEADRPAGDDDGSGSDLVVSVDGEERTYEVGVTPVFARGVLAGWTIRCTDVTDRVRRTERLRQQNERLDRFASIVSHDLRNPLAVAEGYAEQLSADPDLADDRRVREVERALGEMDDLIDGILAMARARDVEDADTEVVDLAAVVDRAWESAATLSDGTATLENDLSSYPVEADPDQVRRAFENLFRNSVEHGSTSSRPGADDSVEHGPTGSRNAERSGDIAEGTSASSRDPPDPDDSVEHGATDRPDGPNGSAVTVRVFETDDGVAVADDGPGIPDSVRDSLFEYGASTDEGSTGIGLATVETIVESHGWAIEAGESAAGGARFDVSIPAEGGRR